jgi:pimeloyl-ACP methyl ester carboxylesterase
MLGFGDSAKPRRHTYSLVEQAELQLALLSHLGIDQPVHVLAHDYGDSVAQELLARQGQGCVELASCVFLNGGLFPESHRALLVQKLLLSPVGWIVSRLFDRGTLDKDFRRIFGVNTRPSESELDDFWSLIATNDGPQVLHRLIGYIPERIERRERWVSAMQRTDVPMKFICGTADPVAGVGMVQRYRELIPNPDTVLLHGIGRYPHTEAPVLLLKHYAAFRASLMSCRTLVAAS